MDTRTCVSWIRYVYSHGLYFVEEAPMILQPTFTDNLSTDTNTEHRAATFTIAIVGLPHAYISR
jgi:hypothetical protein